MSRRYTCPQKGDGLGAPHDQPVKTLTKYVADFIAAATAILGDGLGGAVMTECNPNQTKFSGTENPRHLRVIQALMTRPMPRVHCARC